MPALKATCFIHVIKLDPPLYHVGQETKAMAAQVPAVLLRSTLMTVLSQGSRTGELLSPFSHTFFPAPVIHIPSSRARESQQTGKLRKFDA